MCAAEFETCNCRRRGWARYGTGTKWTEPFPQKPAGDGRLCGRGFGGIDPAPNEVKQCQCLLVDRYSLLLIRGLLALLPGIPLDGRPHCDGTLSAVCRRVSAHDSAGRPQSFALANATAPHYTTQPPSERSKGYGVEGGQVWYKWRWSPTNQVQRTLRRGAPERIGSTHCRLQEMCSRK